MHIYKILRASEWEELDRLGETAGAPVDVADGFIHFSMEKCQNPGSTTVLVGDSIEAFNSIAQPYRVIPFQGELHCANGKITLAAHSVTACEMKVI